MDALCALARAARRLGLPAPEGSSAPSAAIHFLEEAAGVARCIEDLIVPYSLYADLSIDCERAGDLARALRYERMAREAVQDSHTRRAAQLATAMQIRLETDKAKAQAQIERLRAEQLERAKKNLELEAEALTRASHEDALTGLFNRRKLDSALEGLQKNRREQQVFCAVLLDIDHFKRVNDTYSHLVGDEVLRRLGQILRDHCRNTDLAARYGGEEFAVLLQETERPEAHVVCDRLRKAVQTYDWSQIHPQLAVTISVGIAGSEEAEQLAELLAIADKRLYAAKSGGRNRVMSAETPQLH